jgi:hypothetical protein
MSSFYDFDTVRRYILVFSKLFTDIHLKRKTSANVVLADFRVPVIYASKKKSYMELNANLESAATKLPIISIYMENIRYDGTRQKSSLYGHDFISKLDNNIKKHIDNPSPWIFDFSVTLYSKRNSDIYKMLQQILPTLCPMVVKNINIMPAINLSDETKIIYNDNVNNSENEFTVAPDSNKICLYTLNFSLFGWLFPPIKEKKIVKIIELYTAGQKNTIINEYSADDVINNNLISSTEFSETQVKEIKITTTEDKEKYNYFIDLSTEITDYGEKLKILDADDNEMEYVYEYNNGDYYGNDHIIPETLSLTKTGMVCILIPELVADVETKLRVIDQHNSNYAFANDIFNIYVDFNRSILRDVTLEGKTKNDIVYNKNSNLMVKTVEGDCKVFTNNSLGGDDKTFKIGFSTLGFENDKYICGLHTESVGNYVYLKTSETTQTIEIHEVVATTDTLIASISASTIISAITFDFTSGDLEIDVDGQTHTFTSSLELIVPYINWNGTSAAGINNIVGYRK